MMRKVSPLLRMADNEMTARETHPEGQEPMLSLGLIRIRQGGREGIGERADCFCERNAVFALVFGGLSLVPRNLQPAPPCRGLTLGAQLR